MLLSTKHLLLKKIVLNSRWFRTCFRIGMSQCYPKCDAMSLVILLYTKIMNYGAMLVNSFMLYLPLNATLTILEQNCYWCYLVTFFLHAWQTTPFLGMLFANACCYASSLLHCKELLIEEVEYLGSGVCRTSCRTV